MSAHTSTTGQRLPRPAQLSSGVARDGSTGAQQGTTDTRQQVRFFWLMVAVLALWVSAPWLAPVLMHWGWELPARAIYGFYSFQCHQLPERSFFLFGSAPMHGLSELAGLGLPTADPMLLRRFVGSPALGYKVAWSDRMVSMYTSLPLAAIVWWSLRRRLKPLPWWGLAMFLLPMAFDGGTHVISDLSGLGQGFRYSNEWLRLLTSGSLPASFYAGDGLGTFNSWARLLTGVLFGVGVVWAAMPRWFPLLGREEKSSTVGKADARAGTGARNR